MSNVQSTDQKIVRPLLDVFIQIGYLPTARRMEPDQRTPRQFVCARCGQDFIKFRTHSVRVRYCDGCVRT